MNFQINVKLDLKKDARNYRGAINSNTHSTSWKYQMKNISDFDFNQLKGIPEQEAYFLMKDYLQDFRKNKNDIVEEKIKKMTERLDQVKDKIFYQMEKLTKHPIYRNDFTIYLSSLNRGPYNVKEGYTLTSINWNNFITPFIHELLHFQTIIYYKPYIMEKINDNKKFEDLKESLTFLLNYEFENVIDGLDMGYPQHKEFREKLENFRVHSDKDFEKLIDYGISLF